MALRSASFSRAVRSVQHLPLAYEQLLAQVPQLHTAPGQPGSSGRHDSSHDTLYPTHVPLNPLQKGAVAVFSALGALSNPARADLVAAVGETFGNAAIRNMAARMQASPTGRQILAERPRITDAAVAHCWDLPPTTFGGAYAQFMGVRGFKADDRPAVR
eukprot:GHRR01027580.1.p2 GENE.GHRR01027580.1~~GHRR01027580.1.p2  ORF type:complete len:159 (+),score=26.80 GHRR01027580.1:240-716(+)